MAKPFFAGTSPAAWLSAPTRLESLPFAPRACNTPPSPPLGSLILDVDLNHPIFSTPSAPLARRSTPALLRIAADSNAPPPARASGARQVLPAAPRTSPTGAASSSAISSRFAGATQAVATGCPDWPGWRKVLILFPPDMVGWQEAGFKLETISAQVSYLPEESASD